MAALYLTDNNMSCGAWFAIRDLSDRRFWFASTYTVPGFPSLAGPSVRYVTDDFGNLREVQQ